MAFVKSTSTVTDTALTVPNLTGGTDGRVVRLTGNNTVTDASNTNTIGQLNSLLFKQGGIYYSAGLITGLSGLSAGTSYFLSTGGTLTATAPTPTSPTSTGIKAVYIGFAINTTDLIFRPQFPIAG
jgi:F0F1-type ATP synthase membrane subunit c/vacuolar-type H+-ATPase subunit K